MGKLPRKPSPKPSAEQTEPLTKDGDILGAVVLFLTGGLSKIVTTVENLEFLASAKEGGFKRIFDLWNSLGWWLVIALAIGWLLWEFRGTVRAEGKLQLGACWHRAALRRSSSAP